MPESQKISGGNALELSLSDLVAFFKKYILLLMIAPIVFALIGICYSFLLAKRYTAQTILLPEYNMSKNNSFFSMAMGMERTGAEKLVPELYPNILSSTPFGLYVLKQPVTDKSGRKYKTLESYLATDAEPGLLSRVIGLLSFGKKEPTSVAPKAPSLPKDILVLSQGEMSLAARAKSLIQTTVDNKNGVITLACEMKDPVVAAILVDLSRNYLINYVEEYRTSKTGEQVTFLEERVREARNRQQSAEYSLQNYRDRNRNTFLNVARIEEQRLQADFTLAQTIYSDLVSRLEQAKVRAKEEKPVFKILEPVKVPLGKSSPKRPLIGFVFGAAGAFITLLYIIFFREKYHRKLL
nr:Wzz/FepE/Etk N-terminal domain-containing protein [uncultured Dyadobacter sp.]